MGGGITFSPNNLSNIPIPIVTDAQERELEEMADKYSSQGFLEADQSELDQYIYQLFKLDDQDIAIIENFKKVNRRKR